VRAARFVALELLGGCVVVGLLAAGLLSIGGLVEGGGGALIEALPGWLFALSPLLVGIGQGLALLRMELRGERLCLAASGLGPAVEAAPAVWMGLLVGALALGGLRVAPAPASTAGGTWAEAPGGLYRAEGRLLVEAQGGRIGAVRILTEGERVLAPRRDEARRRAAVLASCGGVGLGVAGGRRLRGPPVWLRGLVVGAGAVLILGLLGRLGWAPELGAVALLLLGALGGGWPLRKRGLRG
jgi:hypothetical protein